VHIVNLHAVYLHVFLTGSVVWAHVLLGFTGFSHFLILATVCREWRAIISRHGAFTSMSAVAASRALLKWALDCGCPRRAALAGWAAKGGSLEALKYAVAKGCAMDDTICDSAAAGGHLEMLKWARRKGCAWWWTTCQQAARGGHLQTLRWARRNGCIWDDRTCSAAARGGHLETLRWARENGCEWGADTCLSAAEGGHLHVLVWALERGCEFHPHCIDHAAAGGHLEVVQWLCCHASERRDAPEVNPCRGAARGGCLEVLQWLIGNGYSWGDEKDGVMAIAASYCHLHLMDWAHANACPWDPRECADAVYEGGFDDYVEPDDHIKQGVLEWIQGHSAANGQGW
jgi:hypothetical protein